MQNGDKKAFDWKNFFVSCLIGGAIAVAATLIILLAAAFVLSGTFSETGTVIAADISAALGALIGGFIAEKRCRQGALPCGAVVAVVQLSVCMLVGLIFYERFVPTDGGIALAVSMIAGALVGALLGTRRGGKAVSRHRK